MAKDRFRSGLAESLRLYVISDTPLARAAGRSEVEVARAAIAGGATALQLRSKELCARDRFALGRELRVLTRGAGVLFLVNDRVDLALALDADGVHLGQEDLPIEEARRLLGDEAVIGLSVDTAAEAIEAERRGADYVAIGPIFPTPSKADAGPVVGIEGFAGVREAVRAPLVAIGGIDAERAAALRAAGADGVAVISAVWGAADVRAAAAAFARVLRGGGGSV